MEAAVAKLIADSGALVTIGVVEPSLGRFDALELCFESGILIVECDVDTDEIILRCAASATNGTAEPDARLRPLLGSVVEYAWLLTNHRGYVDGFQLRVIDASGTELVRQFEVAASALSVSEVSRMGT